MRKLLILMVVFGMASFANATLTFSDNADISISDSVTNLGGGLNVNAADINQYPWYLVVVDNALGTISDGALAVPAVGNLTAIKPQTYYPQYYVDVALVNAGLDPTAVSAAYGFIGDTSGGALSGIAIDSLAFTSLGTAGTIDLYTSIGGGAEGTWINEDSINVVVPEPMTMALLGLGGLLLRRRR